VVLVVDDDEAICRAIGRGIDASTSVEVATNLASARVLATALHDQLVAVVLDLNLPDGSGLDFLSELRVRHPELPVLVFTGNDDAESSNRAQLHDAFVLRKPGAMSNVCAFVNRALVHAQRPRDTDSLIAMFSRKYALSERETRVVSLLVAGGTPSHMPSLMGVSQNTAKTTVRRLLKKTGTRTTADVLRRLLLLGVNNES
jgi:FixJ family two-component response regulator